MHRLGETTARLHVAMATAFGRRDLEASQLPATFDHAGTAALGCGRTG